MKLSGRLAASSIAVALIAAGCSGGDDNSTTIEPIEPILASAIEIDVDPSGTTASFSVATSIPVACAVVYGTDAAFGSIAVDNDMQGGAHVDHGPLLTGLAPDTEYQYVLQGSDASGTIYRSEVLTFRTPLAVDTGLGPNLASAGTVTAASSEFSGAFAAANAIDGDLGTEWSTDGDGDDAWIEIDLGGTKEIAAIAFRTRQMTDGTAITNNFTATIDDQVFGPFAAGPEPVVLDDVTPGRIVRIDADDTTGGNTGATEIEIFSN
jgi:hypothetical protein